MSHELISLGMLSNQFTLSDELMIEKKADAWIDVVENRIYNKAKIIVSVAGDPEVQKFALGSLSVFHLTSDQLISKLEVYIDMSAVIARYMAIRGPPPAGTD